MFKVFWGKISTLLIFMNHIIKKRKKKKTEKYSSFLETYFNY